jgi:REP element-mobilizing transposase RayT
MNWTAQEIQFTCSVKPFVSPVFFTARVKGRLQHALRQAEIVTRFSRKVGFRTIGDNRREEVEAYIARQVDKERFVDPRFAELMQTFTVRNANVHLEDPTATNSGRYWYNLHLVLVTEARMRFTDQRSLEKIGLQCEAIAKKKGHLLSIRSVMPDHLHLALRGNIEHNPNEIALAFMNNLAFAFGQSAIWRPGFYVGSFGEYDMGAVRK